MFTAIKPQGNRNAETHARSLQSIQHVLQLHNVTSLSAMSHGAIFLATCNTILLLRGVNLANTRLHYILLMYSSHIKQSSLINMLQGLYCTKNLSLKCLFYFNRYQLVLFHLNENVRPDALSCKAILRAAGLDHWLVGKTKIFLKYYHVEKLGAILEKYRHSVILVQRGQCHG